MAPRLYLSDLTNHCLSFFWKEHPDWFVGYRLLEGEPLVIPTSNGGLDQLPRHAFDPGFEDQPCFTDGRQPPYPGWIKEYRPKDEQDLEHFSFQACADGSARCQATINQGEQSLEWLFEPARDGVWISLTLASQTAQPGAFAIQQCLRFTGKFNEYWRRKVAMTPFLSELDLQALGQANLTLTYARQNNQWFNFPVPYSLYYTSPGRELSRAPANQAIDHGLVVRQSLNRAEAPAWYWEHAAPGATWDTICAGMYWERTLSVSNRHPADCLHAMLDFGPLKAGEQRTLHGKFYWIEGTRDDLLTVWSKEFKA